MKNWGELKNEVLGLMFLNTEGQRLVHPSEAEVLEFSVNMADCANHGLRELSRVVPVIKRKGILLGTEKNLLGPMSDENMWCDGEVTLSARGAGSYYFELWGEADMQIIFDHKSDEPVHLSSPDCFLSFFGDLPEGEELTVRLTGNFRYKSPALFEKHMGGFTVFPEKSSRRLLLSSLEDFMELVSVRGASYTACDGFLEFKEGQKGYAEVSYKVYPNELKCDSPDDTPVPLSGEAGDILAYYMAGRLLGEDAPELSSAYLNIYYQRKSELAEAPYGLYNDEFIAESGWI